MILFEILALLSWSALLTDQHPMLARRSFLERPKDPKLTQYSNNPTFNHDASSITTTANDPDMNNLTMYSSLMADLVSDNMAFPKCWNGSRFGWENFGNYTKTFRRIRLEQDAWDSARLATNVFYRLASEIMGFNVRYMEYTGGYDNVLGPRLQAGVTDVVMEMWSTGIPVVWFDHGSVGYQGRSGMYIPSWLADKHPTLAFDFWRFFQNPAAGEIVWGKSWKPVVNNDDGTPICTGIARGCLNNTYHPDWWTPATDSRFISMWHIDPSWSQYVYERLIDGLKINATISWLGGTVFNDLVDQALNNGTAFVFYNWKPSTFVATRNVTRLMFPDSDGGLIQKWLLDPVNNPRQADESTTIITKATPMSFGNDFPDVVKLLNLISIAEAEINLLLKNMMVNNWTYDQAVCDWMYRTVDTWKTWIPPPPQVISTCPVGQGFYISSGIPICLTCPPSTYDWEVSDKTCSPCPSGAVCPGGSEVDVKHDHWISPKDWRFNQTEPDIYSCPYAATCCDRSSCKPETPCAEGFTGTLCTKCVDTTKYMWRHTCMNCDSYSGTVAVIVLGSFLATFLLLFVPQHETPTVELLLFYFQVVHLIFGIEITNFNGMQNLEKFLALASLDLDGMTATCPAPLSGVAKQLFRFVLPCLFFIDAAILYNIAKLLKQHYPQLMEKLIVYLPVHSKHISVKVIFIRIFQIIITFVLMPLVEACLAILDCRTVMGRVVDFQAPDVVCFQGYHLPAAIFAIFVLIILLCVYPGFIAWQLYRINKADKLKYDEDEENLTVLDELNMTLYSDYRRSYFFMGPVLIWEKGALVLLFKLLNGKVLGIGFVYVCILAVLCFQRIYIQPYLYGIEAYMNREIVLCWLILMAMNLSTLEYDQNIGGAVTFVLILPAALHGFRWVHSAWRGKHAALVPGSGGSQSGISSQLGGKRKGSTKGNSIENLTSKKGGSKKGGSSANYSSSVKDSAVASGTAVGVNSVQGVRTGRSQSVMGAGLARTASTQNTGAALGAVAATARISGSVNDGKAPGLATPAQAGLGGSLQAIGEAESQLRSV